MKPMSFLLFTAAFLQISFLKAQTIAGGTYHSLAVCESGSAQGFGSTLGGQLGDGTDSASGCHVEAVGLTNIVAVSGGSGHSLFLKNDGTVWASGYNYFGQLGDGTTTDKYTPVQVNGLYNIIAVDAGDQHSLFLRADGTVWACGCNLYGQLGDGTNTDRNTPVQVSGLGGITAISGGGNFSIFLKGDGTVWGTGHNFMEQLGLLTFGTSVNLPVQSTWFTNVAAISAGMYHSLFLNKDGTVGSSGYNLYGALGDGTNSNTIIAPHYVSGLTGITAVAAGNHFSLFLRNDGTVWSCGSNSFGKLGDGTLVDRYSPVLVNSVYGISAIAAGRDHSLCLKKNGKVWAFGQNFFGELGDGSLAHQSSAVLTTNICKVAQPLEKVYPRYLLGNLYGDTDQNCYFQSTETGIAEQLIRATPGDIFALTNDTGFYSLGVYDSVQYIVEPIIPQRLSHMIKNPCPVNYQPYLNFSLPKDTSGFDFGLEYAPCHQLRVDVSANRKRRCFRNQTTLFYINEGLVPVSGVEVHVKFSIYDIPVSASMPYTIDATDSSLVFQAGSLNANQAGNITIVDSVACVANIVGLTQCTHAWILPPNQCLIDSTTGANWDNSSIGVIGNCVNDTMQFVIKNSGTGNMNDSSQYRIYFNNILTQTVSFQLNSGDSLVVKLVSNGATVRLEADQVSGHPGYSQPRATLEACGTNSAGETNKGQVNLAPMDDADVDVEIDCMEIRDSYDPNFKENFPRGVGASHIVLPNTLLDYVLHFQNTGSDTAYQVIVIDSLSERFDPATLELGASSHPYAVEISGEMKPVIKFIFNNIDLVDSTTNEAKSHGFVKFKIAPRSTVALGTSINNFVDIFFDYNLPVRTNVAFVTINNYPAANSNNSNTVYGETVVCYPNPASKSINIVPCKQGEKLEIYNSLGEKMMETIVSSSNQATEVAHLSTGLYFVKITDSDGKKRVGKFVKS